MRRLRLTGDQRIRIAVVFARKAIEAERCLARAHQAKPTLFPTAADIERHLDLHSRALAAALDVLHAVADPGEAEDILDSWRETLKEHDEGG